MSMINISRNGVDMTISEAEFGAMPPAFAVYHYQRAVQGRVESVAVDRGYNDGATCASYVNSTVPAWAAEAQAFIAWRDGVWTYALGELAKVETGLRPQPSITALLDELPEISWPHSSQP